MNALIKNGYYVGKNTDLFLEPSVFQDYCVKTISLSNSKNDFMYRFDYEHPLPYEMLIREDDIEKRDQFIKDNNLNTFQRWWQYSGSDLIPMKNYFRKCITDFIIENYGYFGELIHMDEITLFENGDFINEHKDGVNNDRICVFLIYLYVSRNI